MLVRDDLGRNQANQSEEEVPLIRTLRNVVSVRALGVAMNARTNRHNAAIIERMAGLSVSPATQGSDSDPNYPEIRKPDDAECSAAAATSRSGPSLRRSGHPLRRCPFVSS